MTLRIGHADLTAEQRRKANARSYTNVLQRRGVIRKQPCSVCGTTNAQKHHEDYSDPRTVRWLCRECHKVVHGGSFYAGGSRESYRAERLKAANLPKPPRANRWTKERMDPWLDSMRNDGWLCISEVSGTTGIAPSTIRAWALRSWLESKKVGGIVFVSAASLKSVSEGKAAS